MKPIEEATRATVLRLLHDDDFDDFHARDVLWDLWQQHHLVIRCCGSHVPQWMPWPWAYCHCCGEYSMLDHYDIYTMEAA